MAKKIEKNKEVDFVRVSAIVGVIAVILVASMFVSVSITGNVIRQNNYKYGRYSVYTKEEVDSLIRSVSEGSGSSVDVYDKIRNLVPVRGDTQMYQSNGMWFMQCSRACKLGLGTECVLAINTKESEIGVSIEDTRTYVEFVDCDESYTRMTASKTKPYLDGNELTCLCEPPADPAGSSGWN